VNANVHTVCRPKVHIPPVSLRLSIAIVTGLRSFSLGVFLREKKTKHVSQKTKASFNSPAENRQRPVTIATDELRITGRM